MTEETRKKRGWVKNAAIIFLSILLVLTFFSQTIMNHSLPEVAVQYVESGSITTKIRGDGVVTANESYEVCLEQARVVESVAVKTGDTVEPGDTLFILSDAEAEGLTEAKANLDTAKISYRRALIEASQFDYTKDNKAIERAQQELNAAITKRDQNNVSSADLTQAATEVDRLKTLVATLEAQETKLTTDLEAAKGSAVSSSELTQAKRAVADAETEFNQAKDEFAQAKVAYGDAYAELEAYTRANLPSGVSLSNAMAGYAVSQGNDEWLTAYTEITNAKKNQTEKELSLKRLREDYQTLLDSDKSANVASYEKQLQQVSDSLAAANKELLSADGKLTSLQEKYTSMEAAETEVNEKQAALEDLIFSLSETKKSNQVTKQLEALDLEEKKKEIARCQKIVDDFQQESTDGIVKAPVAGIVTAVNVSAGNTTEYNQALAVIEVPDMGYGLSFSVTPEQSRQVRIGDQAEVYNYYWGAEIKATLASIRNDPENPGKSKILQFALSGEEVETGSQLTLSVGQKSANYETIVPNSAIRKDADGDFVLIITTKNTPLGDRYIATRAEVKILASDDKNTAVSGSVSSYDYVITTSTQPIENGTQVRFAE